jgi:TPR repeat protein
VSELKRGKVYFLDGESERALEVFYDATADGDAEGAFDYAFCHQFGYGVAVDYRTAVSFYKFAAVRVPEANYNLAVIYMMGLGVSRDYRVAYEYMRDAAAAGVVEAQLYLGVAHTMGTVFMPDIIAVSMIPYHTPILRDPSLMLEGEVPDSEADEEARERTIRFDPTSAFEYFRESAKHDPTYVEALTTQGKYLYARCFVDGLGVDFNRQRAEDLMLIAAEDGSPDALQYISENAPYRLAELDNPEKLASIRRTERLPAKV